MPSVARFRAKEEKISADAITDVTVVEHSETAGLSDRPIAEIPAAIVENQSLAVDTVSGATNSSNAILTAVADCVAQAGGDVEALKAVAVEKAPVEDVEATYDVVVLGGGGAGLTAFITAAQNGAKVILVEKAGSLGGNTLIAGQGFNACDPERQANTEMSEALLGELKSYLDLDPADFGAFAEVLETVKGQINDYIASGSTTLFDSPELHMLHTYMGGKRTGLDGTVIEPDLELARTFATNALDALEWAESIGAQWNDTTSTILGAMWPRSHGLANGNVIVADTLEELAEKLGISADTFVETIERYNSFVDAQKDDDFGKPLFGEKIDEAPFVATPRSPSLHHTMGGVKIDTNTHVISTEGNVIDGLYAAGEVTGGLHAGNRLGGNAMTDFLVFGRIAGENAAKAE